VEPASASGDGEAFRARHGIAADATLLCVMPGSRRGEVRRLAPVFGAALGLLAGRIPGLHAVVPTLQPVAGPVRAAVRDWPVGATVIDPGPEKQRAYGAADAGLAASGTAAVELAAAGLPSVIGYRVHALSAAVARRMIAVDYVSIPNLVLGREVMPEFLQGACTPAKLAAALERLLSDPEARRAQREGCAEAMSILGRGGVPPSRRAAKAVLDLIGR
jgi:lipid-A-disaccharide synthase